MPWCVFVMQSASDYVEDRIVCTCYKNNDDELGDRSAWARTFQGFQLRPEHADLLVIDEASMLSIPQMLWLVKHAREHHSRVLFAGDSAQHRSVERGDAPSHS